MVYDSADRLSVAIDPEARRVRKVYDLAGQMLQEVRADASPLQQVYAERSYTANGKEAWIKDAKGNQTTYTYDAFDRLKRTAFPDATYEELAYDAMGNVLSKLTRGGQLIQNTYDTLDRMVTHLVPQPAGNPAILTSTIYDLAGRTTQISDNAGHILAYAFDTAKRPQSVTQTAPGVAGTRTVSYQLDPTGNKTRATWADGYYVQYAFDALGRMTTATENGTFLLATYVWDPLSRRTSLVYGNGASKAYAYTGQGDLTSLGHTLTGTSATYTNTFTKAHQLASENVSNAAWQFVPAVFQTTAYSAANALNQYVNVTVGGSPAATMAYDANGNLTGDGTWTFAYDAQNILRAATKAGTSASYAYDPLGRRQAKTVNAAVTTFLSDRDEEIADYAESGGTSTLLRRYVPGPGTDMPIAMVTPVGGSNARAYFHTNRQGSTVAMSADNGTLSEGPYTYDAYGNGAATTGVPFKYTGRRLDPETGLYYYRARYYAPALGRFLQVDPVGYEDQMNLYAYAGSDPMNATDPSGKDRVRCDSVDGKLENCTLTKDDSWWTTVTLTKYESVPGSSDLVKVGTEEVSFFGSYGGNWWNFFGTRDSVDFWLSLQLNADVRLQDSSDNDVATPSGPFKKPKPGLSHKEASRDVPSWAKGQRPLQSENGRQFARRLCDQKYGAGQYDKGPGSEFSKIQKWGDRAFE